MAVGRTGRIAREAALARGLRAGRKTSLSVRANVSEPHRDNCRAIAAADKNAELSAMMRLCTLRLRLFVNTTLPRISIHAGCADSCQ